MTTTRTYTDATGREQHAVDGPKGTFLVTTKRDGEPYEVWRSDSLRTLLRTPSLVRALDRAATAAGRHSE